MEWNICTSKSIFIFVDLTQLCFYNNTAAIHYHNLILDKDNFDTKPNDQMKCFLREVDTPLKLM